MFGTDLLPDISYCSDNCSDIQSHTSVVHRPLFRNPLHLSQSWPLRLVPDPRIRFRFRPLAEPFFLGHGLREVVGALNEAGTGGDGGSAETGGGFGREEERGRVGEGHIAETQVGRVGEGENPVVEQHGCWSGRRCQREKPRGGRQARRGSRLTRDDVVSKDGKAFGDRRLEAGLLVFVAQTDVGHEPECLFQQVNWLAVDLVDVVEGGESRCELQVP